MDTRRIEHALAILASGTPPQIFWAGYDAPRLVHQSYWKAWTVAIRPARVGEGGKIESLVEDEIVYSLPRQWVDVYGERMEQDWETICTMALGIIISRAGISEVGRTITCHIHKRNIGKKTELIISRVDISEGATVRCSRSAGDKRSSPIHPRTGHLSKRDASQRRGSATNACADPHRGHG